MIRKSILLWLLCIFFSVRLSAQDNDSKLIFKGYVKYMQTINYQEFNKEWITQNLFHNRLNFQWFPNDHFAGHLEIRNRFFYGNFFNAFPGYADYIGKDNGFADMSFNLAEGQSYLLNSTIDRLYVDYNINKWQFRFGRHRINWGQNLVWNPNDVFNAYSYFDFDYEERPGTDALRIQYFNSYTSSAEFVYQLGDNIDKMAFMGLYRFNKWNYDIQFLGGVVKKDVVIGTGWSGAIKGGGFRGEITYFHPKDSLDKNVGQLVASISGDYTFPNSLYLQASILYNSIGTTGKAGIPNPGILTETSAKYLTLSRGSLFGQVSYQISPLLRGDLAAIINPFDGSYFVGPALTYSLTNNMELLFTGQLFQGDSGTEFGDVGKLLYMRFKWSF